MSYLCIDCQKEFMSREAIEQHRKDKHSTKKNQEENKLNKKILIISFISIMAIILVWFSFNNFGSNKYDDFAKCLTERGVKMYGAYWCQQCINQKKEFGKSFKYINYIECSPGQGKPQFEICQIEKITKYPTWVFPDGTRDNLINFVELSKKTGCKIDS